MSTIRLACPQGCWWRDNTRGDEIEGKLPLWRKGGRLNWRCKRGKRAARGWETARWSLWLCFVCPLKSECHRIKLPFKNWFFFFSSSFQGTTEADWITNKWSKLLSSFHRLLHFNGASIYLLFFYAQYLLPSDSTVIFRFTFHVERRSRALSLPFFTLCPSYLG